MSDQRTLLIVYPIYDQSQGHAGFQATLKNLNQQNKPWKALVVADDAAVLDDLKGVCGGPKVEVLGERPGGFGALINLASARVASGEVVLLPEGIELLAEFPAAVAEALEARNDGGAVFADHLTHREGKDVEQKLCYIEKPQHERHELGFVIAYDAATLRAIGPAREDLLFTADFDVQLKVTERANFLHVAKPIYRVVPVVEKAEAAADASKAQEAETSPRLHAPGKGKYGGFSYLFYPTKMETELNGVFTAHLKRLGAYLDYARTPTQPVKHPVADYPVKASVVIPVLDRVKYIGTAIESVVNGTFADFEIVVVDNGSKDGSQDAVRAWSKRDARIRLIEQNGKTISSALNRGIREARGKYICQLDSDDIYVPTTLQRMIGHLESHPNCGLAISYYGLMDEHANPLPHLGLIKHLGYGRNVILRRDGAGAPRMFPKVVLEEFGLYNEENFGNFGEDYDMVLKVGEKYDVDRVHEELYRYRRHEDNTDVTRLPQMKVNNKNQARLNALERRIALNKAAAAKAAGAKG